MTGERVPATRYMGNTNSRHEHGYNSGGTSYGFGVLGPRRERHNKAAKALANTQRRRLDRAAIKRSLREE
jgi:hypothetical protein